MAKRGRPTVERGKTKTKLEIDDGPVLAWWPRPSPSPVTLPDGVTISSPATRGPPWPARPPRRSTI